MLVTLSVFCRQRPVHLMLPLSAYRTTPYIRLHITHINLCLFVIIRVINATLHSILSTAIFLRVCHVIVSLALRVFKFIYLL